MAEIMNEFRAIPPVTRSYLVAAVVTTTLCSLDIVSPYSLFLSWPAVVKQGQVWRLVTTFLFFGARFSIDFLFHLFFLVRYIGSLETGSYRSRPASFAYMIAFGSICMLIIGPFFRLTFLGSSLTFMMVYIWARRNPYSQMNLLGLINFTAPYLPWVLLAFSVVLGGTGIVDMLGIAIGHLYYFLEDVYPTITRPSRRLLKTPRFLKVMMHED
uniref:Derlin n=1 Tax=Spongospora subterranea TaxID=70186 RepID=A0A0H5R8U9_9EUKA|eukprot:CRZ10553.1 hypothetical protein [Spongospora subterranea]